MTPRLFPILYPSTHVGREILPAIRRAGYMVMLVAFPWDILASHEDQAYKNHRQSLQQLANRGGLDPGELLAVMEDRPWRHMSDADAQAGLLRILVNAGFIDMATPSRA